MYFPIVNVVEMYRVEQHSLYFPLACTSDVYAWSANFLRYLRYAEQQLQLFIFQGGQVPQNFASPPEPPSQTRSPRLLPFTSVTTVAVTAVPAGIYLSGGAIAGIVVGAVVGTVALGLAAWTCVRAANSISVLSGF